jgi:hypothetical protein
VDWFQEVRRSALISELNRIRSLFPFMSDEWNEVQYLLDVPESWARSYEQFVGSNTRDAELQAQFQAKRLEEGEIAGRKLRVYWTEEEFQPIQRAIQRLLESLGWM